MKKTYELIGALERLRDNNDRARLASLRRGLGQPPGVVSEASRVIEHMLDEDDPPWIADTLYVIAPLFALHQMSYTGNRWSNMGNDFRALFGKDEDPPSNVERRFLALLSSEPDDLPDTLRQAVSLLKSKDVAVNWYRLFDDVQKWLDRRPEGEEKRQKVRLRWSRHFWRLSSQKTGSDSEQAKVTHLKTSRRNTMFVELHIIQNFPPSNLNRDDLGQPKDTDFGGYRRARISSQCLKRATRYAGQNLATGTKPIFERYTSVPLSSRTKLIVRALVDHLESQGKDKELATRISRVFAESYAGKMDQKRKTETAVLLYLSEGEKGEIKWVVDHLLQSWDEFVTYLDEYEQWEAKAKEAKANKKRAPAKPKCQVADDLVKELIKETHQRTSAPDIALFGRMLADKPETNIDAACQVAHAISTHAIDGRTPIDYFTAIDDLKTDPGAAFLDVAYFNSACFYRYARVDFGQLEKNLGGDHDLACRSVEAFLRASEAAIPTGKKNAYAHECRPSFMLTVLREKESDGWSLVNAFQKPVDARSEGDLIAASVKHLEKQFEHLISFYSDDTVKAFAVALPDSTVEKEQLDDRFRSKVQNMQGWVDAICKPLRQGG